MTIRKDIDVSKPLTPEQRLMIEKLVGVSDEPDEDCPELTNEQLSQMRKISEERAIERRKQTVTLRLSPQAIKKAKSLGKGYTSVLSRILETALSDNEIIKHYL